MYNSTRNNNPKENTQERHQLENKKQIDIFQEEKAKFEKVGIKRRVHDMSDAVDRFPYLTFLAVFLFYF